MSFGWTKTYMPRSLFGRAALILVAPVVVLQLVVAVVFVERHFAGVAEQLTRNLSRELRFVLGELSAAPTAEAAQAVLERLAPALDLDARLPETPAAADARRFYDFSGRQMIATLRREVDGVAAVDLAGSDRAVQIWLETEHGPLRVAFERRRIATPAPHQLLVLMLVTGVLMTIVAFLFLRNQLRPIARLARAATAFGRGRIEPYRPSGATEVRMAGNAFLDMRARIDRQIEQRTMMLSGVSHDMRTPLTRLKLGLSMLEPDPEVEELRHDVADMERLLDEFLAFARGEALDDPEAVDPAALVAAVVERYRTGGAAVTLTAESGGRVMLRPLAVARALDNLIGNALRYGERCEVRVALTDRAVRIAVEDDGPGIPATQRGEALKPFVRLDAARNQDRGSGVGLGLAIAQDIARRHGGVLVLGDSGRLGGLQVDLVLPR